MEKKFGDHGKGEEDEEEWDGEEEAHQGWFPAESPAGQTEPSLQHK